LKGLISRTTGLSLAMLIAILIPLQVSGQSALAQNDDSPLFLLNERPFGITNGEWTAKWWKWLMEIPQPQNPAVDLDGTYCSMGQSDPNVWFITGTFGGKADRKCEIPFGKAIFFGHGYECSTAETPNLKTYGELLNCASEELKTLVDPSMFAATLDGKPLSNLTSYKAISPPFKVNLPENNIWGVKGGLTLAAANGYFIFLKPLDRGNHTFTVSSMSAPSQVSATNPPQTLDVKYNFIIK
jgi:hypothetical protein